MEILGWAPKAWLQRRAETREHSNAAPRRAMSLVKGHNEVEAKVVELSLSVDPAIVATRARLLKATLPIFGLDMGTCRRLIRTGFSFSDGDYARQLRIWDHIWQRARIHEVKLMPLLWLEGLRPRPEAQAIWEAVSPWAKRIDCWDQSDMLSKVYARLLEERRDLVHPVLVEWNSSANPWLRRQSLVSLLYQSGSRRSMLPADQILFLAEARIDDPDHYVQRGIGWTLRECGRAYPQQTLEFLHRHATALSTVAWSGAARDIEGFARAKLAHNRRRRTGGASGGKGAVKAVSVPRLRPGAAFGCRSELGRPVPI